MFRLFEEQFPGRRRHILEVGGLSGKELKLRLEVSKVHLGANVADLLDTCVDLQKSGEPKQIETILLEFADLGVHDYVSWPDLVQKVRGEGLQLCPKSTGPHLRLAYEDQPVGGWVNVLSEPLVGSYGFQEIFTLARDEDRLDLYSSGTGSLYNPDSLLALRLR